MIVEYTLEANGTVPTYIADGGYFEKANANSSPQDWDMIGHTVQIPGTSALTVLDKATLITRLTNLGYTVIENSSEQALGAGDRLATAEEIENIVDDFISKYD